MSKWPTSAEWSALKAGVIDGGWGDDIAWQDKAGRPETAEDMALEAAYVILNSGMAYRVTSKIWPKIRDAITAGEPIPFGHAGKCSAMQQIWNIRHELFRDMSSLDDETLIEWCETLPWIGPITKFHLAKNWGCDVCKPDVWIARLAGRLGEAPDAMCQRIAAAEGERVATVDLILWAALSNQQLRIEDVPDRALKGEGG